MKYRLNLIGDVKRARVRAEAWRIQLVSLSAVCFGLLAVSLFYAVLQVLTMQTSLREEKARIVRLMSEYQHYKSSKMIVNKADVELLDKLQNDRIFWTKKLVSIARYLPDNYWITRFSYKNKLLTVEGTGDVDLQQQQLISLDDYLNALRVDPMFRDVFKDVYLNKTSLNEEEKKRPEIGFSYSAVGGK